MSKAVTILAATLITSVLITSGTYFISRQREVTFAQPLGTCALPNSPATVPVPIETDRGFPVRFKQTIPRAVPQGICGYGVDYSDTFSYRGLAIDLLEWGLLGFLAAYVWLHLRSGHA